MPKVCGRILFFVNNEISTTKATKYINIIFSLNCCIPVLITLLPIALFKL